MREGKSSDADPIPGMQKVLQVERCRNIKESDRWVSRLEHEQINTRMLIVTLCIVAVCLIDEFGPLRPETWSAEYFDFASAVIELATGLMFNTRRY